MTVLVRAICISVSFSIYLFFLGHQAVAIEYPCRSAKLRALLYVDNVLAVTELHDDEAKECIYSINGATGSNITKTTLEGIRQSLGQLGYLMQYYRNKLPIESRKNYEDVISKFSESFIYLASAPRLDEGDPQEYLESLVKENIGVIKKCFTEFYKGKFPKIAGENVNCQVSDMRKDVFQIRFDHQKLSHIVHTFR